MSLTECTMCRVGSTWSTGICPVCGHRPDARMPHERVSKPDTAHDPSARRKRILDRLWRLALTRGAAEYYRVLLGRPRW